MNYLSIVNLDLQFFQAGCSLPSMSFLQLYFITWCFIILITILFIIACCIRFTWFYQRAKRISISSKNHKNSITDGATNTTINTNHTNKIYQNSISGINGNSTVSNIGSDPSVSLADNDNIGASVPTVPLVPVVVDLAGDPRFVFKSRLIHSMLILCCIIYLRISILTLQGINCENTITNQIISTGTMTNNTPVIDDTTTFRTALILASDGSTICYQGNHLLAAIFFFLVLLVFSIGFPIGFCILLRKRFFAIFNLDRTKNKLIGGASTTDATTGSATSSTTGTGTPSHITCNNPMLYYVSTERFGFLFFDLQPIYPYFRFYTLLISFILSCIMVFVQDDPTQQFVMVNYTYYKHFSVFFLNFSHISHLSLVLVLFICN